MSQLEAYRNDLNVLMDFKDNLHDAYAKLKMYRFEKYAPEMDLLLEAIKELFEYNIDDVVSDICVTIHDLECEYPQTPDYKEHELTARDLGV